MVQFIEVFDGVHNILAPYHSRHLGEKLDMIILIMVVLSPFSWPQNLLPQGKWQRSLFHWLDFCPSPHLFHLSLNIVKVEFFTILISKYLTFCFVQFLK